MLALSAVDMIVVGICLTLVAVVGSSFYRRNSTAKEYFLGSRGMSWIPVGISIIAADLSAVTVMGIPAWAYSHNFELAWNTFGYVLAAPIVLRVFLPFYAKLDLFTAYEYLERRFDVRVRTVASLSFLVLRGMHVAFVIYAPSIVISMVTGVPAWQCIAGFGLFTTIYTTLGGMKAVIWTDVIQFAGVLTGIVLTLVVAVSAVPGGPGMAASIAYEGGRLDAFNFSPDPSELTSIWACLIGGVVLALAPLTTDQAILQRLFATKTAADFRRSILLQAALVMPVTIALFGVGAALYVFYRQHPDRLASLPQPDALLPFFVISELPRGVAGLVIAAICSASLAVMSAGINSLTTATTMDFYHRLFRPGATSTQLASFGRAGTVFWGAAATVAALFAGRMGDLAIAYNRISSIVSGPLLGVFLLATLSRRATGAGALWGAFAGALAVGFFSAFTDWSFLWFGPVGCAATVLCGACVSLLMRPPEVERIQGLVIE